MIKITKLFERKNNDRKISAKNVPQRSHSLMANFGILKV